MGKQSEGNSVSTRNYFIAIIIIFFAIGITWYGFKLYNFAKEKRVSSSYLINEKILTNEIKNIDEVIDVFSEPPTSYFIYISYVGDENIYKMEKELSSLIKEYNLEEKMYYLNVTDIKDEDNALEQINSALGLNDKKVTQIPTIIYYKDGIAVDIIKRQDNNIMTSGDLKKLLDVNRISK